MFRSVSVVGAGTADVETLQMAEEVGGLLGKEGVVLVCGGLGGVMEAACRGANAAGGRTIGILPGQDVKAANPYVDFPIATGLGEARNTIVVSAATEAVIAVGGEFGTLSEIGFALKLGKRVVGLRTWELAKLGEASTAIRIATNPTEAVRLALER